MIEKYEKLKGLLAELFQLDQPDLDFGLYRIMRAKRSEISKFLDNDLFPQVKEAFKEYQAIDKSLLERRVSKMEENLREALIDPDVSPVVRDIHAHIETISPDVEHLINNVYDHLYHFFRRYYSEGDFMAKRVYKSGVYAIPYEGEEITLHWANKDQYYIKSSEYLRDYTFRLQSGDDDDPMRVHFKLSDATESEHNNNKAPNGKGRVFVLASSRKSGDNFIFEEDGNQGKELIIRFEYRPSTLGDWPENEHTGKKKPPTQRDHIQLAIKRILSITNPDLSDWITGLSLPHHLSNGNSAQYSKLEAHIRRYTARNTYDFFIHKDLGTFLRRELDFYIKNEVIHLDDVQNSTIFHVQHFLSTVKVIRTIANKIIDFLAQLEDFQKKLWLKKKFITETSYCITIGTIPEKFYPEIINNQSQCQEWIDLYAIDKINGDLVTPGYTDQIDVEFLNGYPTLMIDTRYFSDEFTSKLLESFDNIDQITDGVLINGDNFQSLNLIQNQFQNQIDCVYIDPPYNTGDSEILYKNSYLRSSWLSLISSRLDLLPELLANDPILYIAIDDFEMVNLAKLIDITLPEFRREIIIINHHPQGGKAKVLAHTHEYMITCVLSSSDRTLLGRTINDGIEQRPFKRSGTAESNFRYGRPNSFYAILIHPTSRKIVGLEPPPRLNESYPIGSTDDGLLRVYPLGIGGEERVWRRSYESCAHLVSAEKLICRNNTTIYQLIDAKERKPALFSNWVNSRYNAGTFGANLVKNIIGEQNSFSYPKSVHCIEDAIFAADLDENSKILDFFAGSGTTGHAVINLNREDGGHRKFTLVEVGRHFDTVLIPRLKKVTFTPQWKNGLPKRHATAEEAETSPRVFKVIRLESYEDTLNNLEFDTTPPQKNLLYHPESDGIDGFREKYTLRYMLDVETRGSQSLLNVQAFNSPQNYRLNVKIPGSDENQSIHVDLIETFNWLIGLTVKTISAPHVFTAEFQRDQEKRLHIKGDLRPDLNGSYWFRTITGSIPDGQNALVIWRTLHGNLEKENLVLDKWFMNHYSSDQKSEFDIIWVNGGTNLEKLKNSSNQWEVRLIEDDFHSQMFNREDAL